MTHTFFRVIPIVFCGLTVFGALSSVAVADITWTIQPSTQLGSAASIHFTAFDTSNPNNVNPDPNSETYVPPIDIVSVPQTDPGTSGDPALGNAAVNSMLASASGVFITKGNTPTTSLNFGNPTNLTTSALTLVGSNVGSFYPSTIPPPVSGSAQSPGFLNGQPVYNFGTPSPVNSAGALRTQSPLSGFNNLTGTDFSQSSRDDGRYAIFGLKALPVSTAAIPVTGGVFDASQMAVQGSLRVSITAAAAMDPSGYEGVSPISIVIMPADLGIGRKMNELIGAGALGTITRSGGGAPNTGPDYLLSAPFLTSVPLTENSDGSRQFSIDISLRLVAKANILPGDVNFDGVVNAADRTIILQHLGQTSPDHLGIGDANGDGVVNTNDLSLVPEPATFAGLAMGVAMLGAWRLRRG